MSAHRNAPLEALVTVRWGDSIVASRHLSGDAEAAVGAAPATVAPIPCDALGQAALVVARARGGAVIALVPDGAVGFRERPRAIPSPVGGPSEITLAASETVSFSIGEFVVTVTAEEACRAPWAALLPVRGALGPARYFVAAALAHALLIGVSAQAAYASSLVETTPDHEDLQRYLAAAEERSNVAENILTDFGEANLGRDVNQQDGNGEDGGGTRAKGREGAMGSQVSRSATKGRFGIQGDPNRDVAAAATREEAIKEASEFGMIGALSTSGAQTPVQPFWTAGSNGPDPFDANGAMWATSVGETFGAGGLGLTGAGEGGGGKGEGSIGLGSIGTIGHTSGKPGPGTGGGGGMFGGFGLSGGWSSWSDHWGIGIGIGRIGIMGHPGPREYGYTTRHVERPEKVAVEGESRLPAATIRRIVQQSHGTFRACYQSALVGNPRLAGGVTTRFLIGADGRVKSASNLSADLPDSGVVACVTRAFSGLAFPEPPGGRPVTVTYPLTFSPAN